MDVTVLQRLATVTTALLPSQPRSELVTTLESLLLPSSLPIQSTSASISLQLTALQSIRLLSRSPAFSPSTPQRSGAIGLVRDFLTSPELGRWTAVRSRDPYGAGVQDLDDEGPGDLVKEAAETWIALVSFVSHATIRDKFTYSDPYSFLRTSRVATLAYKLC
jgi:hypothetical protein